VPEEIPELLGIQDLLKHAPRGIGRTTLYLLLHEHGVSLSARRRYLPRDKWFAWLKGELAPLPSTTHPSVAAAGAKARAQNRKQPVAEATTSTGSGPKAT